MNCGMGAFARPPSVSKERMMFALAKQGRK